MLNATVIAVCCLSILFSAASNAADWRFNNFLPENRPESKELDQYALDVKSNSNGEINLKIYSGSSLGLKTVDVLRYLPRGAIEMGLVWSNYLGRDAPELSNVMVQGTISSVAELNAVLPVAKAIYTEELEQWGIKATGFIALSMLEASIFCREEAINSLAALKGKKLRDWAKDQVDAFSRLGISAQIIPQEDMYVAMKTGVVDCAVYPALYAHTVSLQEVSSYAAYLYPMSSAPYILGISSEKWRKLPDAHKKAITDAGNAIWARTNSYEQDHQNELKARARLQADGIEWLEDFPVEDRRQFTAAITATWEDLAMEAGGDAPAYRDRILKALGR